MTGVYVFAAIVGWPCLFFCVFFGGEGGDVDADFDIDIDVDADLDVSGGPGGGIAAAVLSLLSFRSLVFFLAFFGATGLILDARLTGSA
ncbi:MAG: hypothetical protein MUP13_00010, partial [Thermoanaerobaculales bacterium]|nr:hypothetical protein [Thermoanaerobaculales bacterium]